jgi:hypothetical protein
MTTHICPVCSSQLHTIPGNLVVWIIADGRVLIETASARPTDQHWLELSASAQNQLTEIMRVAHETAQTQTR